MYASLDLGVLSQSTLEELSRYNVVAGRRVYVRDSRHQKNAERNKKIATLFAVERFFPGRSKAAAFRHIRGVLGISLSDKQLSRIVRSVEVQS